jgi:hypothetical protein
MTCLWLSGAETGHNHAEGLTLAGTGTASITTAAARSGSRAYLFQSTASNLAVAYRCDFIGGAVASGVAVYASAWYKLNTGYPASTTRPIIVQTASGTALASIALFSDGSLQAGIGTSVGGTGSQTAAALVSTTDWFQLKLKLLIDAGATDELECYYSYGGVDTLIYSGTGLTISDTTPGRSQIGYSSVPGANEEMYADDFIVNADTGSAPHNTYATTEKLVLLLPTADSADGNWTDGAGGTASIFEAVNNIPPTGVSTATSGATNQAENASSTVSSDLDMTMTTYTAAGIASADTITAVQTVIAAGGSDTAGSNTITHELVSNPTVAASGTTSTDTVAGTYPTSWNRGAGTLTENPSVTKSTAPVMRVTKTVSTTRIHTVCLMGIYVSYLEGVAGTRYRAILMIGMWLLIVCGAQTARYWLDLMIG